MRKHWVLAMVLGLAACHQAGGTYDTWVDRDKWMLTYHLTRMALRGHPREVKQYVYYAKDTGDLSIREKYYIKYGFDADGNMVSRKDFRDDTLIMQTDYWVDGDGQQDSVVMLGGKREVTHSVSRRLSDGRYKIVRRIYSGQYTSSIEAILTGGDEKIREYFPDSTATGKPYQMIHFFYSRNRLMKVTGETSAGPQEYRYFYSEFDAPDSIWIYNGSAATGTLEQRQLFLHNDHGDVAREIIISGKDTTSLEDDTYTYDAKGNWVRRVMIPRKVDTTHYYERQVSVIDQVISY